MTGQVDDVRTGRPHRALDVRTRKTLRELDLDLSLRPNAGEKDSRKRLTTPIMQVADVVAYLLSLEDWVKCGLPLGAYRQRLYEISKKLDPALIRTIGPIRMRVLTAEEAAGAIDS